MSTATDAGAPTTNARRNASDDDYNTRGVWTLRLVGAVLLVGGWAPVALRVFGPTHFIFTTLIFAALGVYTYTAAAITRRSSVEIERKLRHRLLVHNMELTNMAMRDDLTQLFNRRYFFDRLERELQTAAGLTQSLCVMVIDLDSMKAANDAYGHRVGDQLLASVGRFLANQVRASDSAARIGGDEFAILLPDTSPEAAAALVDRIEQRLESTDLIDEQELTLRIGASFGLSCFPADGMTADALMQAADAAMFASKRDRKNGSGADTAGGETPVPAGERL